MGGLHKFTRWNGPILTDSGGFQVFSLAKLRNIKEEGVYFNSHIDGRKIFMGPEESMRIQSNLASTIAMAFDECVENPSPYEYTKNSVERTTRWLKRCVTEMKRLNSLDDTINKNQMLFGINQGGIYDDLRVNHMKEIAELNLDGYAIGGLAVGEPAETMYHIIEEVEPFAPKDKIRYLMAVTPFDKTYETPDDFSERIARNQQLLLKEECHFNKVVDPAAGSYFIENLTISIATQAWELFLKVEDEGGMLEAVKAGKVQEAINASNKARHDSVSKRKEILLGTNQYPNFNEKAGEKAPVEAKCCCGGNHDSCEKPFATLNFDRAASQFEALRLQTEKSGKRPKAFMLTIGNLAMRQARAQFSCNFLACAGYEVIDNLGFPTVEAGVEAAMKAGADIVVICSEAQIMITS